jgi:hypothetical protein
LFLRKRKKRIKMNQSKGILAALGRPEAPRGKQMGPTQDQVVPREARPTEQDLIGVIKKGRKKEKEGL